MAAVKVRVKVHFTIEQATKAQRGSRVKSFFNLGARCECVVYATVWPIYPQERPGTHCIEG